MRLDGREAVAALRPGDRDSSAPPARMEAGCAVACAGEEERAVRAARREARGEVTGRRLFGPDPAGRGLTRRARRWPDPSRLSLNPAGPDRPRGSWAAVGEEWQRAVGLGQCDRQREKARE